MPLPQKMLIFFLKNKTENPEIIKKRHANSF